MRQAPDRRAARAQGRLAILETFDGRVEALLAVVAATGDIGHKALCPMSVQSVMNKGQKPNGGNLLPASVFYNGFRRLYNDPRGRANALALIRWLNRVMLSQYERVPT